MNIIKCTIGMVALAAVAETGYGDGAVMCGGAERKVDGAGEIAQTSLDLSEVWDKQDLGDEPILWSSLGWEDTAEEEGGKTVTLQLVPLSGGEGQTLGSGLKGYRQTYNWTPSGMAKQVYVIRHVVVGGSPLETDLNAYFSFENYEHVAPREADVRAAIRSDDGTGWDFGIANDAENWWKLAGGPGEGIKAQKGKSTLTFTVDGHGTLAFDYALEGGAWTVKVDGVAVRTLAAVDWTGAGISTDESLVTHKIEFVTELSDGDFAALRNVRWVDEDDRFGDGRVGGGAVDLREGALVVQRAEELMPVTWSSTNFTGNALVKDTGFISIDPQSGVSVRIVRVTGEGDDVSRWTAEVADTVKTLVSEKQGEGTVVWKHVKPGVWKAEFAIRTGGEIVHTETRVLDLRRYVGPGLILILR